MGRSGIASARQRSELPQTGREAQPPPSPRAAVLQPRRPPAPGSDHRETKTTYFSPKRDGLRTISYTSAFLSLTPLPTNPPRPRAAVHLSAVAPRPGPLRAIMAARHPALRRPLAAHSAPRAETRRNRTGTGTGPRTGTAPPPLLPAEVADETAALLIEKARPTVGCLHPALPRGAPVLPEERHGGGGGLGEVLKRRSGSVRRAP